MAGQRFLVPSMGVRIPLPQPPPAECLEDSREVRVERNHRVGCHLGSACATSGPSPIPWHAPQKLGNLPLVKVRMHVLGPPQPSKEHTESFFVKCATLWESGVYESGETLYLLFEGTGMSHVARVETQLSHPHREQLIATPLVLIGLLRIPRMLGVALVLNAHADLRPIQIDSVVGGRSSQDILPPERNGIVDLGNWHTEAPDRSGQRKCHYELRLLW